MSNGRKLANIILGTEVNITNVDSDLANSISSIKTRLDSDDTKLQSLDTAVKAGFTNLADSDLIVSQLTAKITSVITNLDSDTIALQTVNTKIGLIKSRLDSDDAKLQAIGTELSSEISTTNTEISSIKSRLDSDDAKLQLLDTSIQTIKGRLDSDDGAIQTLTSLASVAVGAAGLSDSDLKVVADLRNELDSEILTVRNLALSNINYTYTATADQTTYSGTDNNSLTLAYTAGTIQVFLNGIKLDDADFTATDGTSVNLVEGAQLGHQLTIIVPSVKSNYSSVISINWSGLSQAQKVTASDAANSDFFGNVVDVDGDYAVVGARLNFAAYIFYYNGSTWSEQQKIQETTFGSSFGYAVSISGDTVVIGSSNTDVNSPDGTKAYVYTRSGTTWSLQQKVDPSQAEHDDFFGYQRTMKLDKSNNNQFIAGSSSEDESYSAEGAVYIFTRSGTTWTEQQRIVPADGAINSNYGITADIAGDYAVFGGRPGNNFAVYVWTRSGTTWSQQTTITQPSGHTNSQYAYDSGLSINSTGDTIAVGAYGNTSTQAGKVFIFTRSGTTWTNQAVIQPSDTANGDYFGWDCQLDTTGDTLVVGAKLASTGGKVYVFTRSGTSWTEQKDFTASDVAANWEFGEDVAIDGSKGKIVVGARQYNSSNNGQGAVYIFDA